MHLISVLSECTCIYYYCLHCARVDVFKLVGVCVGWSVRVDEDEEGGVHVHVRVHVRVHVLTVPCTNTLLALLPPYLAHLNSRGSIFCVLMCVFSFLLCFAEHC